MYFSLSKTSKTEHEWLSRKIILENGEYDVVFKSVLITKRKVSIYFLGENIQTIGEAR